MAIVEDEVHNDSEEENEIEVVVDEEDGDQDSEIDSEDEEEVEALESKVAELERRIAEDPYSYEEHIELIQALWGLSELERWRAAFNQLQQLSLIKAEHWLTRIQTEIPLAHSQEARDKVTDLFKQAALDCYSVPLFSEWCAWTLCAGNTDTDSVRAQIDEVVRRAGADPLSGKLFWDAKTELEKSQLEILSEEDPSYKEQMDRLLFCLEEIVSRPLLRGEEVWPELEELALKTHDHDYLDKLKKQHDAAVEYLNKITPYEDKLLTLEDLDEKCKVYQEYIDLVKELEKENKYRECDSDGLLKVLYDRATSECVTCSDCVSLLKSWSELVRAVSSRTSYWRVLDAATRRRPTTHFWVLKMRQAEHEGWEFDEVKQILETALSKGSESFKESEALWMCYLEYMRRHTSFTDEQDMERLRKNFRLAWDTLAESWGAEANDCEIPLFWARLEYRRFGDPKRGKEIFEEIFKYGENKTLFKNWDALIRLESIRECGLSESKFRDLLKRALKFVTDYPPGAAALWTNWERDYGTLDTATTCLNECEIKIKEWRDNYQAMKEKMTGQKNKGKQPLNKKGKFDKRSMNEERQRKGKRKADEGPKEKKKREDNMELDVKEGEGEGNAALKRTHAGDGDSEATDTKRVRTCSTSSQELPSGPRDACTLFVSNLEFKVNEENLRKKLSKFGEIVSMRVRSGVKAFGGSICYCQYKSPSSVDEAIKHDRSPLDGRPMFLSRYSSGKGQKTFKYPTTAEKNKLFVRNLPFANCTKDELEKIFGQYGKLSDVRVVTFKDGKPKGLAYIDYEDEASAANALEKTNGMLVGDRKIEVAVSAPPPKGDTSVTLGQAKRDITGGMRRTQLSSFIPTSVIKASTSQSTNINGNHDNENTSQKRPLSNSDFRSMLLKQ